MEVLTNCRCGYHFKVDLDTADPNMPCPHCGQLLNLGTHDSSKAPPEVGNETRDAVVWTPIAAGILAVLFICLALLWALLATADPPKGGIGGAGGTGTARGAGAGAADELNGVDANQNVAESGENGNANEAEEAVAPVPVVTSIGEGLQVQDAKVPRPGRTGGATGGGMGDGNSIFDLEGTAKKVVYVIDKSGSMQGHKWHMVKAQLEKSLATLTEDKQFGVIFYDTQAYPVPRDLLVPANDSHKNEAIKEMHRFSAAGSTDPTQALNDAFAMKPETIWLLSDGAFDHKIVYDIRKLNSGGQVSVNTIAFYAAHGGTVLEHIANENNGVFRSIP